MANHIIWNTTCSKASMYKSRILCHYVPAFHCTVLYSQLNLGITAMCLCRLVKAPFPGRTIKKDPHSNEVKGI